MPQHGASRAYYIISRLKRENLLDLVEAVERGKISAYAIAVELGWAKGVRPIPVTTVIRRRDGLGL